MRLSEFIESHTGELDYLLRMEKKIQERTTDAVACERRSRLYSKLAFIATAANYYFADTTLHLALEYCDTLQSFEHQNATVELMGVTAFALASKFNQKKVSI
eukprot:910335-Rhodomonas_salina.1